MLFQHEESNYIRGGNELVSLLIQPMAERLAPGDYDQLHHFVAASAWDAAPLEKNCSFKRTGSLVAAMRCW